MTKVLKNVIKRAQEWSKEEQEELAEYAREIESRRSRIYVLSEEERLAIAKAKKSKLVPEKKMRAFWKGLGVA
ncbi:hypothetical protein HYW59_02415 [Candidatus Kaiserbacteria bacterium]|nr:hypothetical protein [Candidatus Kaiserbacteria bacterium]